MDGLQVAVLIHGTTLFHFAAPDGGNLATAKDAVANQSVPENHTGGVYATVVVVAATEGVTAAHKTVSPLEFFILVVGLVGELLLIAGRGLRSVIYQFAHRVLSLAGRNIDITDIAIVDGEMGCAKHGTALAATVGIALNGGDAIVKAVGIVGLRGIVAVDLPQFGILLNIGQIGTDADDDMRLARDIVIGTGGRCVMIADMAFPAAAIDITHRATLDIGVGGCFELA